jgi:Protein of unknown function (DUF3892)
MIRITARHMEGGADHEHIAAVRWHNPENGTVGETSREALIAWIDRERGKACVEEGDTIAVVAVIPAHPPYLRTHADNQWTDHLLALPEY